MTFAMACTLHKELEQLNSHSDLQALVIRSEGRHFCDGGDPSSWVSDALAETKTSDGKGSKFDLGVAAAAVHEVVSLCTVLSNFSVPVLAILQGSVRGVGLALALAVDWRVCTSDARFKCENSDLFGLDEAMRGIVGPRHGLQTANLLSSTIQAPSILPCKFGLIFMRMKQIFFFFLKKKSKMANFQNGRFSKLPILKIFL